MIQSGHETDVDIVAWSHNGGMLATVSGSIVRVWDWERGLLVNVLKGDFRPVERLLWSPNGQLLITSDYSSTRIWDVASGRVLHEFEGEFGACNDDFTALWTHCEDTTKLWDIEGGKILQAVAATITSFSPNDRYVVVLGGPFKQKHRLYDTETKRVLALLPRGLFGRQYSWSPDSQKLAIKTGIDRCVWVWDCQTGEILQATQTKDSVADLLAWSPDGVLLAVATEDGAIHLWNAKDGQSSLLLEHCGVRPASGDDHSTIERLDHYLPQNSRWYP